MLVFVKIYLYFCRLLNPRHETKFFYHTINLFYLFFLAGTNVLLQRCLFCKEADGNEKWKWWWSIGLMYTNGPILKMSMFRINCTDFFISTNNIRHFKHNNKLQGTI